jgi:hypothetical protein
LYDIFIICNRNHPMSNSDVIARRLSRWALVGQLVSWAGFVVTAGSVVAALVLPSVRESWLSQFGVSLGDNAVLGVIVAGFPAALFAFCLFQAALLFAALGKDAPFSARAVGALVALGWAAVVTAVAGVVSRTALYYLASLGSADGKRALVLSLSSVDIGTLLVGVLALVFALVVAETRRLEDDARSIV